MLKGLRKLAKTAIEDKGNEMTVQVDHAQMSQLQADLAELAASVTELTSSLATVTAEKEAMTAELTASREAAATAAKSAADAKMAARKEKVMKQLGDVRGEKFMAATAALDDASFEGVFGALALADDKEASTPAFSEQGVDAEADLSGVDSNPTMDLLRAKYAQDPQQ